MPTALRWPLFTFPQVIRAGRFPLEDRDFAYRYRSPTIALHIYDYEGTLRIGRREFLLRPGDLTITPALTDSRYDLPRPGHHWCIHFSAPVKDGPPPRRATLSLPMHMALGAQREHAVQQVLAIAALLTQARSGNSLAMAAAQTQMQHLLLWLALLIESRSQRRPTRSERAIEQVVRIVGERFAEPLSIPELSRAVHLSQNYLAGRFRQRMGVTLPRYLLTRRLDYAMMLLHTTDMPIRAVACRVGIPDPQHFNKQFRRHCGQSPSRWREHSRQELATL